MEIEKFIIDYLDDFDCRPSNCIDSVKITDSLRNDIGMDSLDVIRFIVSLEDEFSIDISDDCVDKIHTVNDAIYFASSALLATSTLNPYK